MIPEAGAPGTAGLGYRVTVAAHLFVPPTSPDEGERLRCQHCGAERRAHIPAPRRREGE